MNGDFSIGELARSGGCNPQTIRYYEQVGLMPQPVRTLGNQRRYDEKAAQWLTFIRHARELGFPVEVIREFLKLSDRPELSCASVDAIAKGQVGDIGAKIARLNALKTELMRMIRQCHRGRIGNCRIIEVLVDHSQCLSADHKTGIRRTRKR